MQGAPAGKRVLWKLLAHPPVFREHLEGSPTAGSGLRGGSGARHHVSPVCRPGRISKFGPSKLRKVTDWLHFGDAKVRMRPSSEAGIQERQLGELAACRLVALGASGSSHTKHVIPFRPMHCISSRVGRPMTSPIFLCRQSSKPPCLALPCVPVSPTLCCHISLEISVG